MENYEKYLGLPMVGGNSKVNTFRDLQEKIAKRVMGWKDKFISKASREILIKIVTQAFLHTLWEFSKSQRPFVIPSTLL